MILMCLFLCHLFSWGDKKGGKKIVKIKDGNEADSESEGTTQRILDISIALRMIMPSRIIQNPEQDLD